jgi:hypothetical protein
MNTKSGIIAKTCGSGDLEERLQQIRTRADLSEFIRTLALNLREQPDAWENRDLSSFLEALSAWTTDMDGFFKNRGEPVPEEPAWSTFARMLFAAKVYE